MKFEEQILQDIRDNKLTWEEAAMAFALEGKSQKNWNNFIKNHIKPSEVEV